MRTARILYFGDHDPDGWEIPRSCLRGINRLAKTYGRLGGVEVKLERIALNMKQIREHNPPPFPAKMTSARYRSYVDEHGTDDAWELDALNPRVLRGLIDVNVRKHFDVDRFNANIDFVERRRDDLRARMSEPGWNEGLFEGLVRPDADDAGDGDDGGEE